MSEIKKKVFLFDIDSTLLNSGGLSVESYRAAFTEIIGEPYSIRTVDCSGRTDPWIVSAVLRHYGHGAIADDGAARTEISRHFLAAMRARVAEGYRAEVLPGGAEVLEYLSGDERAILALLTGNLMEGARLKLQAAGILHYFTERSFLYSAFGSDHPEREQLAFIAFDRLRAALGADLLPRDVWVVGDSVHDIACARAADFRVLAVASGSTSPDLLAERNPDILADALEPETFSRILRGEFG